MTKRLKDFVRSRPDSYTDRLLAKQAKKRGLRANTRMVRRARMEVENELERS